MAFLSSLIVGKAPALRFSFEPFFVNGPSLHPRVYLNVTLSAYLHDVPVVVWPAAGDGDDMVPDSLSQLAAALTLVPSAKPRPLLSLGSLLHGEFAGICLHL